MAGTKRKADASRGSSSHSVATGDTSIQMPPRATARGKVSRSSRSQFAPTASSTPSLVHSNSSSASSKASSASSKEKITAKSSINTLKEPCEKRQKLSPSLEAPTPSRYSTRLRARAKSPPSQELPPRLSPQSPIDKKASYSTVKHEDVGSNVPQLTVTSATPHQNLHESQSEARPASPTPSNVGLRSRKRKSEDLHTENTVDGNSLTEVAAKKPKLEEGENSKITPTSFQTDSAASSEEAQDSRTSELASEPINSPLAQDSAESQNTEDIDNASSVQNENVSNSGTRGRGNATRGRGSGRGRSTRGRGRGAAARGTGRGRGGRGGGGRGGGKGGKRGEDGSDREIERERSPPPNSFIQRLLDRQKELKQNWKRLAGTQKLILSVLAERTQQRLARDKDAHRKAPEFEEVQTALEIALHKREKTLENEYRLRVQEAETIVEAEMRIIQDRYQANADNIQDEYFYTARGEYMSLVEGVQHADDDEHTEPDVDGPKEEPVEVAMAEEQSTTNYEPLYLNEPRFQRGYNSKFIRDRGGVAAYEMGRHGWDDFMQRAKMKEISQDESDSDPIQLLLQAAAEAVEGVDGPLSSADRASSQALSALADAASNVQPVAAQRVSMPLQPQPQPHVTSALTDQTPSFLLSRPPPQPPAPPASRPILSTSHGLPDLFTAGGTMRQLPPPPGVNVEFATRPGPLPGFIPPGQHQQPSHQYQRPLGPTPGPTPATATAPYYFPGHPQPHSHQPPPPPQPPATNHRRY